MVCKNCNASFEGKFCSNCGQPASIHRLTIRHFLHELFHAMTHADKGFLLLARELLIRPGYVAREYVDGKRKKYFNPLSFLVITAAISAFVTYKSGYFEAMSHRPATASAQHREPPNESMLAVYKAFGESARSAINNQKFLDLFLIFPSMSVFTWLLF